jgi:cell division protein FtsI (penicillin-binding protein 3)/stage V sporulation protein D (sporulation-specific penicillin-binding protein)
VKWNARTRIFLLVVFFTGVFTLYSVRLIHLQVNRHSEFTALAAEKNSFRQTIHANRGRILDAAGEVLATDRPTCTIFADGSHIKNPDALAALAAPFLEIDERELARKLSTEKKYVVIRRGLPEERAIALRKEMERANMRGLYSERSAQRIYPNGALLGHVLGFLDFEGRGIQGIEMTYQDFLAGEDGFRFIERDRTGREIVVYRGLEKPARDGYDVQLTVDMALQAILEEELENAYREIQPQSITGVMVNPKTGEILAIANRPNFDPNAPGDFPEEAKKNRAIIEMVEPGSTFKIVAISAALNEKIATPDTKIFCENGSFFYGGKILRDVHGYGVLSLHDILVKSSNIGCAKLAMQLGEQKFYEYVRAFGFGERTGVDLPGEIPGLVHPPHRWSKLSITRIPMGHEIAVTPLQLVMAHSVIANGGKLMVPQIVKSVRDANGEEIFRMQPQVVRQVITPETAAAVNAALTEVVSPRGTAPLAKVAGFSVAGKTGTAQRVDPNGGYTPGKYVVSFVGYLPAEDPAFVAAILIDDARNLKVRNYGGLVAAPIFSRVAERAARYLDIVPPPPAAEPIVASVVPSPTPQRQARR